MPAVVSQHPCLYLSFPLTTVGMIGKIDSGLHERGNGNLSLFNIHQTLSEGPISVFTPQWALNPSLLVPYSRNRLGALLL
jgi:hypothetical protein